jgi:teichuronic acid biosynthesis glycosyltransferase TuaG
MNDISVIMPHYNNGLEVRRAYESIINQSLLPKEIIIIDDCSLDKSILLDLEKFHHSSNIPISLKIIYLDKNSGPSIARNLGVKSATGIYIAFLDSDDVWHVDKLKIQYNIMVENKLNFTFHIYSAFPQNNQNKKYELKKKTLLNLAKKQIICTPTVMIKKDSLCDFESDMRHCEDFLCWIMSNKNNEFYYIDCVLANGFKKQYGQSGLSSNMKEMHLGVLKTFNILYKNRYIKFHQFLFFSILEYLKYPLRVLKSKIN